MLILKEGETCPHGDRCPYVNVLFGVPSCQGVNPQRKERFTCDFIKEDGSIADGQKRNSLDITGKMKVLYD